MQKTLLSFSIIILLSVWILPANISAQIFLDGQRLDTARVADNLHRPWELEFLSEDTALVTSLTGDINLIDINTGSKTVVYTVTSLAQEVQSGLMGMAVHPNYPAVNEIYIANTYYDNAFNIILRIQKLNYNSTSGVLENPVTIIDNIPSGQDKAGGRILISTDLKLYVSVGDVGNPNAAQNNAVLPGKILRYNLDGSIPANNPFAGSPVYTLGHRNPQGLCEGPNGQIYISEHGNFGDDEVSLLVAGRNYGWPIATGFCNSANQDICDSINMMEPLDAWTPSIAPSGIAWYGDSSVAGFSNSILVGALAGKAMAQVKLNAVGIGATESNMYLTDVVGRIRDISVSDSGRIYLITSNTDIFGTPGPDDDILYELVPSEWSSIEEQGLFSSVRVHQWENAVMIENPEKEALTWKLYSMGGKPMAKGSMGDAEKKLSFDNLKRGFYVFQLEGAYSRQSLKIVIK